MKQSVKTDLVAALRSGKYSKANYQLRTVDDRFCVNGVLCDLAVQAGVPVKVKPYHGVGETEDGKPKVVGYSYDAMGAFPPAAVTEWAGIERDKEYLLSRLSRRNDTGASFDNLADLVEEIF